MSELSAQIIGDASDEDLPMLVWEAIIDGADGAPLTKRHFYLVELLNFEVGNGGFLQYFHNTRGCHVEETFDALAAMNAGLHRAAFAAAVSQWDIERAELEAEWASDTIGAVSRSYQTSRLPLLDGGWDAEPIEPIEAAFIRRNVEHFVC